MMTSTLTDQVGAAGPVDADDAPGDVPAAEETRRGGDRGGRVPRLVLVLPDTTYRAPDFLEAARAVGAEVVVATNAQPTLRDTMGSAALTIRTDEPERAGREIAEHARTGWIDGVVGVDDRGVEAAAVAQGLLGLPHNPLAAVRRAGRKDRQREALAAGGVAQPAFALAQPDDDVAALAAGVGVPCVVKPTTRSGSQGVLRADTPEQAEAAAARVRRILAEHTADDPDQPLLVEAFAPGAEVAVEGLLRGGRLELLAVFDKPDHPDGPTFAETIYATPTRLPDPVVGRLRRQIAAAAEALGLREGPVHAEARVADGHVTVLELAARSIGGLCSRSLRFGAGVSLEEVIVRHALGLPAEPARRELAASGVLMVPIPERGVLEAVEGVEAARALPGVEGVELTLTPGQETLPVPEGDRYLGFAFARGATPEDVTAALRAVQRTLVVRLR